MGELTRKEQGYLAMGGQTAKNADTTPTTFIRFQDEALKIEKASEQLSVHGDGRDDRETIVTSVKPDGSFSMPIYPVSSALVMAHAMGNDRVAGSAVAGGGSSTLSGGVSAGATDLPITSETNFSGTDWCQLEADYHEKAEICQINSVSAGHLILKNATPTKYAHDTAVAVKEVTSPYFHRPAMTDVLTWVTLERMVGASKLIDRIKDAKISEIKISGEAPGKPLKMTVNYMGTSAEKKTSALTETLEATMPLIFHEADFYIDIDELKSGISDSATTVLTDYLERYEVGDYFRQDDDVLKVSAKSAASGAGSLTVDRAQLSTIAASHATGVKTLLKTSNVSKFEVGFNNGLDDGIVTDELTRAHILEGKRKVTFSGTLLFDDEVFYNRALYGNGTTLASDMHKGMIYIKASKSASQAMEITIPYLVYLSAPVNLTGGNNEKIEQEISGQGNAGDQQSLTIKFTNIDPTKYC